MQFITIKNFKCFHDATIPLNGLTVLTGGNGNGKSTAVQSVLLLRRTVENCLRLEGDHYTLLRNEYNPPDGSYNRYKDTELNGVYNLQLGTSESILPIDYENTDIEFITSHCSAKYSTNLGNELWISPIEFTFQVLFEDSILAREFYYLNAERIGPRIQQTMRFHNYKNVGTNGEYTAQIIAESDRNFKVDEKRQWKEGSGGSRFTHHINSWLSYILDGASIESYMDEITQTSRIMVDNQFSRNRPIFPTNTGFGISYSLPIIVTGLIAEEGRIFIVENPEAHLHPAAQSRMGYFLGVMANAGVNIIVETHSDHIVNGIQLAVAKKELDHNKVTINYFANGERNANEITNSGEKIKRQPNIVKIDINEKGELSDWPNGFFDQTQVDFAHLIELRRRK